MIMPPVKNRRRNRGGLFALESERVCVRVWESEKEIVCACACACMCVWVRERENRDRVGTSEAAVVVDLKIWLRRRCWCQGRELGGFSPIQLSPSNTSLFLFLFLTSFFLSLTLSYTHSLIFSIYHPLLLLLAPSLWACVSVHCSLFSLSSSPSLSLTTAAAAAAVVSAARALRKVILPLRWGKLRRWGFSIICHCQSHKAAICTTAAPTQRSLFSSKNKLFVGWRGSRSTFGASWYQEFTYSLKYAWG